MGRNTTALYARGRIDPRKNTKTKKYERKTLKKANEKSDETNSVDGKQAHVALINKINQMSQVYRSAVVDVESDARPGEGAGLPQTKRPKHKEVTARPEIGGIDDRQALPGSSETLSDQEEEKPKVGPSAFRSTKRLYALPTRKELETLKEAENLFKSGLFRFQMEELLKHVHSNKVPEHIQTCVNELAEKLTSIEKLNELKIKDGKVKGKFPVPFQPPLHVKDTTGTSSMDFRLKGEETDRQCKVDYIGSVLGGLLAQPSLDVDVCVEMPRGLLQHQDRKRFRYLYKRAVFLAYITSIASKLQSVHSITYESFQGDEFKPILCIRPYAPLKTSHPKENGEEAGTSTKQESVQKKPSRFRIIIHVVPPDNFFKINQLGPTNNTFDWDDPEMLFITTPIQFAGQIAGTATPRYTLRLVQDVLMQKHAAFVADIAREFGQNFKETVLLLKTWLRQRGFTSRSFGTMNGFVATMLLAHLLQQREIPREASPYQMFRKVLAVLATSTWNETPLVMKSSVDIGARPPPVEDMQAAFLVCFIDPSGFCNLLGQMTIGQYDDLRFEAARGIHLLESDEPEAFAALFLARLEPLYKFDTMLHAKISPSIIKQYPAQILDRGGQWIHLAMRLLPVMTRRGLGDRATVVVALNPSTSAWDVTMDPQSIFTMSETTISIGIQLNMETCYREIDILQSDEDSAVAEFTNFWGEKAALRSLPDGSLRHAVVWDTHPHQRHLLIKWIALHVLSRHAKLSNTEIAMQPYLFEPVLAGAGIPHPLAIALTRQTLGENIRYIEALSSRDDNGLIASQFVSDAFTDLARIIRRLDLPLNVRDILCVSSTYRLSDPFPSVAPLLCSAEANRPLKHLPGEASKPVIEVVIQFESSSRWPEDVAILQQVKLAFLIRICSLLEQKSTATGIQTRLTRQFLDITYRGAVFRLVIHVDRELTTIHRQAEAHHLEAETLEGKDRTDVLRAAAQLSALADVMTRDFQILPQLSTWIRAFAVQFPTFGYIARLAKQWIHSHMFSSYIADEVVDLLVLALFNRDEPYGPPSTPDVGFLRFLHLVSHHNWVHDPFFVDPDGSLSDVCKSDIRENFRLNRDSLPIMFIVTSIDQKSSWTKETPSKLVFQRLVRFARSAEAATVKALTSVINGLTGDSPTNIKTIFSTPLGVYDVVFHVNPDVAARYQYARSAFASEQDMPDKTKMSTAGKQFKNLELMGNVGPVRAGCNPIASLFRDLQSNFSHVAMFWYNEQSGRVICAAIKPEAKTSQSLKINKTDLMKPQACPLLGGLIIISTNFVLLMRG